jgi:hypothetical protein
LINTGQGQLKNCSCLKIAAVKTKILSAVEGFSVGRFVIDVFIENKGFIQIWFIQIWFIQI